MMKSKQKYWSYGTLILAVIGIIFISGCVEKECKTNDDCLAKACFTAPQCKDNNCVYSPILDCCGNDACEREETYTSCPADCPDCDDYNDCTINDRYDYYEQKCINKLITPCCGNNICDERVETHLNCQKDCPNCDDDNKLTTDSFNYDTQECENPVTHYFIDDFEEGIRNWTFSSEGAGSAIVENGNTILRLFGTERTSLQKEWVNYIFKFRFKRIDGDVHVDFRRSVTKGGAKRYYVGIADRVGGLGKQIYDEWQKLSKVDLKLDKNWHTLEIRSYDDIINVYVDDKLLIKYKDTTDPLLSGWVSFELHSGGRPIQPEFLIDDVEIKLITEKDIIYP